MYFALRTGFVCTPLLFLQKYKSTGITVEVDLHLQLQLENTLPFDIYICKYTTLFQ